MKKNTPFKHLPLDLSIGSKLQWKKELSAAQIAIENGSNILWELDLGLFDRLQKPLTDPMQFSTLSLGLKHFAREVWPLFNTHSLGCTLYVGSGDFPKGFIWNDKQHQAFKEWLEYHGYPPFSPQSAQVSSEQSYLIQQFCRNVCIEFMQLLQVSLPEESIIIVCLDMPHQLAQAYHLASNEHFEHVKLLLNTKTTNSWKKSGDHLFFSQEEENEAPLGIVIPPKSIVSWKKFEMLEIVLEKLEEEGILYRLLPEPLITHQWESLEHLLVLSSALSFQGKRALQGFCSAGGTVVFMGEDPQLFYQMSWDQFIKERPQLSLAGF